jgi:hypothetical protein
MGKMATLVLVCVLSIVCGFLGALASVSLFHDQLQGPQGATGLTGPPGAQGPAGVDGADGVDGARGAAGKSGRAARAQPVDLGSNGCSGRSVDVVTDVTITAGKMHLTKKPVCVTR